MHQYRYLIASLLSFLAGIGSALAISAFGGQSENLQAYADAYRAGDAVGLVSVMSPNVIREAGNVRIVGRDAVQVSSDAFFRRHDSHSIVFRNVRIDHQARRMALWFDADLDGDRCAGAAEIQYNLDGLWTEIKHKCYRPLFSWPVEASQALDVGTTAIGLNAGLSEANPVVSSALDGGLGVPLSGLKLFGGTLAENLDTEHCRGVQTGLSVAGTGASGWNLALLAGGGPGGAAAGLIAGALLGHHGGKLDNLRRCQGEYGPVDIAYVAADQVLTEVPALSGLDLDQGRAGGSVLVPLIDH